MRHAILTILVLLLTGEAKAIEWAGSWDREGGSSIELTGTNAKLSLETTLPVAGKDRALVLAGAAQETRIQLSTTIRETVGIAGALEGRASSGKEHRAVVTAVARESKDATTVEAVYSVDGKEVRRETWTRTTGELEIVEIVPVGQPLTGVVDPKDTDTKLVIRYRTTKRMPVQFRVEVAQDHPFASFYARQGFVKDGVTVVHSRFLGFANPGAHELEWDGRDGSSAKRIVLGGNYRIVLTSSTFVGEFQSIRAERGFSVPVATNVAVAANDYRGWRERIDADTLERDLGVKCRPARNVRAGFEFMRRAAGVLLVGHGGPTPKDRVGAVQFGDDDEHHSVLMTTVLDKKAKLLNDLHFAFLMSCDSGTSYKDGSIVSAFVRSGADVAIGFDHKVFGAELDRFAVVVAPLIVKQGAPIEKAARDAARAVKREVLRAPGLSEAELDVIVQEERRTASPGSALSLAATLVRERAAGIDENETAWPPRYGNSQN